MGKCPVLSEQPSHGFMRAGHDVDVQDDHPLCVSPFEEQQIESLFLLALMASDVVLWSDWCLQQEPLPRDLKVSVVVVIAFILSSAWQWGRDLLDCLVCVHLPEPPSLIHPPFQQQGARSPGMLEQQKLQPEAPWNNPKTVPSALEQDCSEQREWRKYHLPLCFSAKEMPRTSGWSEWKWGYTSLKRKFYFEFVLFYPSQQISRHSHLSTSSLLWCWGESGQK